MIQVDLPRAEKIARLRLWRTPRVGPATYRSILERFGTAEEAIDQLPAHMKSLGKRTLNIPEKRAIVSEIESLHAMGGRFIFDGAPEFPPLLSHTEDSPPVLGTIGNLDLLQRPCLAIVGSRAASLNGKRLTAQYARAMGQAGFAVVSGLAKGIDAAAHEAALPTGTIAVVAGGLDMIYPRENHNLHQAIARDGLIVSEQPLGMPTSARLFPLRNRLVSGLSLGTLVVEANARSGSLITARLAGEQGREVMAVPGSPLDGRSEGTNQLIRQGATLIAGPEDLHDVFATLGTPAPIRPPMGPHRAPWAPIGAP